MQNRVFAKIFIALFLILTVVSCKVKDQSELYGAYLADYDVAKEKLTINEEGSFVQEVTLKATSKVDTTKGSWTYDSSTGYVRFNGNFMAVINGLKKIHPTYKEELSSASLPADKYFGFVMLGSAEGVLYKKVK